MVKKIECRVIRSVPLTQKTSEHGQPKRANRPSASIKTVRGENAQLKPYEQSADNTAHSNDKVKSDNDKSFGWYKFAEEAAQGQFLDVWA
ncbi:MAG: hypothetical protein ACYS9C_14015 [Planctomycetota bacterium]|jgi:hypothetical protein